VDPRLRAAVRPVARPLIVAANTPLAKARAKRAFADAPRPIKLEIGGHHARPGWVVTDVGPFTRNYLDATRRWPLEDASVSVIYADNVIEHIPLAGGRAMLAEAYRCLVPGGVIRLVTPDIRSHVEMYLAGQASVDNSVGTHYRKYGLTVEHPIDLIRIPIGSFGHHLGYVYDYETLAAELQRAGFSNVARCELGESSHPDLVGLDDRASEGAVQVAVEATR